MNARVLIVIPTLNEAAHIAACVRALADGQAGRAAAIVVADGGSTDGTCEIVQRLATEMDNVHLMHNPGRIQAAAVNLAVRALGANCDVLIRCDAHADYPPRYIERLLDALRATGADSVVVPMDARGTGCFQRAVAWIVDTPLGSGGAAHRGGARSAFVDHGHHAAFAMARFRALGGYDETFSHNEDAEYDRRLTLAGGRIWLDAGIRIGYYPRAGLAALWRQYASYGRGRARMLAKHALAPAPRQMLPVINLVLLAASACAAPFLGFWALSWPGLYLACLAGASLYIALRKRSLCGLSAGPALGAMHIAWALGFVSAHVARKRAPSPSAEPA